MSTPTPPVGSLTYTRSDSIDLPQSAAEARFAMRRSDWQRIKRQVNACKSDMTPGYSGWYFLCFGVAGSALLTLVPLYFAVGLPAWVMPFYFWSFMATAAMGGALFCISRKLRKERTERIDELKEDMSEIEACFGS